MMLCDISVVFNSFADAFGLMNRKRSSEEPASACKLSIDGIPWPPPICRRRSSAMPSQYFASVSRCGRRSRCRLDVRLRGKARRIAVNIAKLPELLQKIAKISGEHIAQ